MSLVLDDMPPIMAGADVADGPLADAVNGRNLSLAHTAGHEASDFANVAFCQSRSARALSTLRNLQAHCQAVLLVMGGGAPFKIARRIVRFVAVDVVDLRQVERVGNERRRDKTMHVCRFALVSVLEAYRKIAALGHRRAENATDNALAECANDAGLTRFSVGHSIKRPNLAGVRHLIDALIPEHVSPFFGHEFEPAIQPALNQGAMACR